MNRILRSDAPVIRPVLVLWHWLTVVAAALSLVAEGIALLALGTGIVLQLWVLLVRNLDPSLGIPLWLSDASTLSFVVGGFLYVARTRTHIGFSGLPRMLNREALARRVDLVTRPIVAACLLLLTYQGYFLVKQTIPLGGRYSPEFFVPLWMFYAIAPVTFAIIALSWLTRGGLPGEDEDEYFDLGPQATAIHDLVEGELAADLPETDVPADGDTT